MENTSPDPQKTGSLYGFSKVLEQLIPDDAWYTQQVIAHGNHIVILVNGKMVVDFIDQKNTYTKGYLALQQHNDGSIVQFKKLADAAPQALGVHSRHSVLGGPESGWRPAREFLQERDQVGAILRGQLDSLDGGVELRIGIRSAGVIVHHFLQRLLPLPSSCM